MKTGALIAFSCEAGAILAGASRADRDSTRAFGRDVGLAFQIVDDLLDVEGDQAALGKTPNHLTLVDTAAQAYIHAGRLSEAEKVTSAALAAFEDEGWAHGSHARVLLAEGEPAKAVSELDRAVELSPRDASLYALRGDATREVGSRDEAKASYEKALQLDPSQPRALSGFVALLIDMGIFARAAEIVEQMDDAKVRDLRADEQRVRYLVRTGAGQSGVTTMRNAVGRHKNNVALRLAGARVYLQAEDYARAGIYFQQAKRNGANARLAETALALAQIYGAESSAPRTRSNARPNRSTKKATL